MGIHQHRVGKAEQATKQEMIRGLLLYSTLLFLFLANLLTYEIVVNLEGQLTKMVQKQFQVARWEKKIWKEENWTFRLAKGNFISILQPLHLQSYRSFSLVLL